MAFTVVQWATGSVGTEALKAILARDDMELVGVHTYTADKVGVDAGVLSGQPDLVTGITATDSIEQVLTLHPDCVSYTPLMPNVDDLVRLLEAGINVVSTSNFMRGDYLGAFGMDNARQRLDEAGKKGGAAVFGNGYNPGFVTLLPIVMASIHSRVDKIEIHESADLGDYESGPFFDIMGWGVEPPDSENGTAERPPMAALMDGFLYDSLDMIAEACGFEVTDRVVSVEYATTPEEISCPAKTFDPGTIAGQRCRWQYLSGDESVIDITIVWYIGDKLVPNLMEGENVGEHRFTVYGAPTLDMKMSLRVTEGGSERDRMQAGMIGTAMSALNAVPYVCKAEPGLRSLLDMPPTPGLAARHVHPASPQPQGASA